MAWMSQLICSLLVIACTTLVPTTGVSTVERRTLIDAAIQEAKYHAAVQNDVSDNAGKYLRAFKKASPQILRHGQARLLYEDIVRRAEMKILEKEREGMQTGNIQDKIEILAKELLHTPGRLLTKDELALVYEESECPNFRRESELDCTQRTNRQHRTPNGECNNLDNPLFGAAPSVFRRLLLPRYEDGVSQLRGTMQSEDTAGFFMGPFAPPNPSARLVSNEVVRDKPIDEQAFSHFLMQWGQWIDHDVDESPALGGCPQSCDIDPERCVPIPVASDDPKFSEQCIAFPRSIAACDDSKELKPREQINTLTSFIDGSQVYGSSETVMNALRERDINNDFTAFLKTGEQIPVNGGPSLPRATQSDIDNGLVGCPGGVASGCFLAGDIRANEQTALTVLHTIWMREHNRIAAELQTINPHWSPDKTFKVTREIVAAEIQKITYKDYLPKIMGQQTFDELLGDYSGYNPQLDPSVPNAFAAAAYRFGHSQIRPEFDRLDESYQTLPSGPFTPLPLVEMFFNPPQYKNSGGTDPIVRGLLATAPRKIDEFLNSVLTQQLFAPSPNSTGMDLASLNIQRGRDHGLAPYLTWNRWAARNDTCGMSSEIRDTVTLMRLLEAYGSLETVDLWVGGLAEARVPGGLVGATFACIFAQTFGAIRNGDRFYYENVVNSNNRDAFFTAKQRNEIEKTSLSRVICDNADNIQQIQADAFRTDQSRVPCSNIPKMNLMAWKRPPAAAGCAMRLQVRDTDRQIIFRSGSKVGPGNTVIDDASTGPKQQAICLPFVCPTAEMQNTLTITTPNDDCSVVYTNFRLPQNRKTSPSDEYETSPSDEYMAFLSDFNIGQDTGAYPDLASCEAGSTAGLLYTCRKPRPQSEELDEYMYLARKPPSDQEELIGLLQGLLEKLDGSQESVNNQAYLLSELKDALDQ